MKCGLFALALVATMLVSDSAEACGLGGLFGGRFYCRERVVVRNGCGMLNRGCNQSQSCCQPFCEARAVIRKRVVVRDGFGILGLWILNCNGGQCVLPAAPTVVAPATTVPAPTQVPAPVEKSVPTPEPTPAPVGLIYQSFGPVFGFNITSK